jgi:hypothetical protein
MQNKFARYISLLIIVIFIASCSKHNQSSANENICVARIVPKVSDYNVSGTNLDSINALFAANNLSTANLQFQSFGTDTTVNIYPTAYSGYQEQIAAVQFFNGLPVFADNAYFTFNAGVFQPSLLVGYTGPSPNADTTSHQSFANLRNAFLAHVPESYREGGAANSKPFIPSASTYINACLDVTLGYLDADMVPESASAYNKALIKVWSISPSNDPSITYYPLVYVEDDNGKAWGVPFLVP